jgi:hypothetical protein
MANNNIRDNLFLLNLHACIFVNTQVYKNDLSKGKHLSQMAKRGALLCRSLDLRALLGLGQVVPAEQPHQVVQVVPHLIPMEYLTTANMI